MTSKTFQSNQPISMVEFMYPLGTGIRLHRPRVRRRTRRERSTFQYVGRSQPAERTGPCAAGGPTLPLLVGLDGSRKMSKSYDNYIAFNDSSKDIFGKVMSISDDAMWSYFRLLLLKSEDEIGELQALHPMESKKETARELTALFFGDETAKKELASLPGFFQRVKPPRKSRLTSSANCLWTPNR